MALYRASGGNTENPYSLYDICKYQIEHNTPTVPTAYSGRLTGITGGYVELSNKRIFMYLKGTDAFPSWGAVDSIRSMAMLQLPNIAEGDFNSPHTVVAYNITQDYITTFSVYNHATYGGIGQLVVPANYGRFNGDEWLIYGMYLKA